MSNLFSKGIGTIVVICLWNLPMQHYVSCHTYKTNSYGYSIPPSYIAVDSNNNNNNVPNYVGDYSRLPEEESLKQQSAENNNWRNTDVQYGDTGLKITDKVVTSTAAGRTNVYADGGGPVIVHGGSVVLRPPAVVSHPEGFVVDREDEVGRIVGPVAEFGLPAASSSSYSGGLQQLSSVAGPFSAPQHYYELLQPQLGHTSTATTLIGVAVSGLLQSLHFGQTFDQLLHTPSLDRYLSFCNRLATVGRFLSRLAEPLFTTGFYMAVSYFFRRSIWPKIVHYVHVYTVLKDHDRVARLDGRKSGGGHVESNVLAAVVNRAIDEYGPCLRKIVCEAGQTAAGNPLASSFRRMAKKVISRHELAQIFKESLTGSVSDCNQYTCRN